MPTQVTWPSGTTNATPTVYSIPNAGEVNWPTLTNFLVALGNSAQSTTSQRYAVRIATTTPVTVSANDCVVGVNLTVPGATALNLPAGVDKAILYVVDAKGDAKTNNITITPNGTDTINGAASFVMNGNSQGLMLAYNLATTNWIVTLDTLPNGNNIPGFTPSRAIVSDAGGYLTSSTTTAIEIGYVNGVTSSIQTQLNAKQPTGSYITALTGDVTASGPGSVAAALTATTNATLTTISTLTSVGTIATGVWAATTIAANHGGTGLASGTSGGILGFTGTTTIASSALLAANQVMIGGGAGATPTTLAAGSQYQVLVMGASNPGYGQVNLAQSAAITGTLPVGNGGTAVTSLPTTAQTSAFAAWDANKNLPANNLLSAYTTTATAATTTTLTVASTYQQFFTGSTTQTVVLPVTSTLVLGFQFRIVNASSGVVTIQSSGANTVQAMAASTVAIVTCVLVTGTTAASWSVEYISATGAGTVTSVAMTVPSFLSIGGSPITTTGTLAITLSGTALPVLNGGTGVTTSTGSGNNVLSTSPTLVTPVLGAATGTSLALTQASGSANATFVSGSTGAETFLTLRNSTPATVGSLQTDGTNLALMASSGFGLFVKSNGACTLGDNSNDSGIPTDAKHYASSSSNSTSTFVVRNWLASTPTNADNVDALVVAKPSTTVTSGTQFFVKFSVSGETTACGRITSAGANAAQFSSTSDIRIKKNIIPLESMLEKVTALRPVEFDYIDLPEDQCHQTGFIAQEMQKVFPDSVAMGPESEGSLLHIVGWDRTTARLVQAIKELTEKVKALEAKLL